MNPPKLPPHIILIALNVAIFLLQEAGFDWRLEGALWQPENPNYHIWQWFTHMFLHESLMHLGFNMFALGSFMPSLLRVWSAKRVWALYFASGLAGAAAYLPFMGSNGSMLGASGAVFGVLAAFSAVYPKAPLSLMFIPVPVQARYLVGGMVLYEVFAQVSGVSLFGDNIAHMAHGGGALMGWAFAWQWQRQLQR
ncbi:MAG: rhomboid family intramembrane serine protease [Kingella oralis]